MSVNMVSVHHCFLYCNKLKLNIWGQEDKIHAHAFLTKNCLLCIIAVSSPVSGHGSKRNKEQRTTEVRRGEGIHVKKDSERPESSLTPTARLPPHWQTVPYNLNKHSPRPRIAPLELEEANSFPWAWVNHRSPANAPLQQHLCKATALLSFIALQTLLTAQHDSSSSWLPRSALPLRQTPQSGPSVTLLIRGKAWLN